MEYAFARVDELWLAQASQVARKVIVAPNWR
jgi:hypothetical protein